MLFRSAFVNGKISVGKLSPEMVFVMLLGKPIYLNVNMIYRFFHLKQIY
jgi:hypothetical protein